MSKKGRTLALAATTAALIGLGAPMASAATAGGPGDTGGLVNVSHNQVPIQVCNNKVPVNVLGVQVPVSEVAASLGLLSPGITASHQDSSCHQASAQNNAAFHVIRVREEAPCCERAAEMGYGDPAGPAAHLQDGQLYGPEGLLPVEGSSDTGGLLNVSHNQVPIQICNNKVPVNVLGVQVPVSEVAAVLGLLAPGPTLGLQDSSCHQASAQNN